MSIDAIDLSINCRDHQDNQSDYTFKYLDLLKNSDYLLRSNVSILTALNFLSQCFDKNVELDFLNLSEADQTSVINILISLIYALQNIYQSEVNQLEENDKYLNDISQTLIVLSQHSNEFINKFNGASDKAIESILSLIQILAKTKKKAKAIEIPIKKLLEVLNYMSKFHENYEKNWKNGTEILECLKNELTYFDEEIDTKWLLFKIVENLKTKQYFIDKSFDFFKYKNKEIAVKIGLNLLDYLDNDTNVCETSVLIDFIHFIYNIDGVSSKIEIDRKKIVDFYSKLADQNLSKLIELVKEYNQEEKKETLTKIRKKTSFVSQINLNLGNFFDRSIEYSNLFHQNSKGLSVFFNFIENDFMLDFYVKNRDKIVEENYNWVICALYNLSRLQHKFLDEWNSHDPVNKCLNFLEKAGASFELMVYLIVANIASDDQIKTLPELKKAIEKITEIIRECADALDDENRITRTKIQINENEEAEDVIGYQDLDGIWNIMELLEALYHMSVNDTIKKEIYETYNMKESLKKLTIRGNNIEKSFSLKLLYQLCFDKTVIYELEKDKEFYNYLQELSKQNTNHLLKKNCDGILWKIDGSNSNEQSSAIKKNGSNKHVMISYNGESRKTCLAIKEELEKRGFKIWIDVENIAGSSLESMAAAIEESSCILMGMTEKYKMSPNCRLEAEYAVQLNKPIVPLILQKGYKPDGWLGIILGAKIFVNFNKYTFEECIRRLLVELSKVKSYEDNDKVDIKPNSNSNNIENKHDDLNDQKLNWSEEQVEKWLKDKNFNDHILDNIRPCDGKILNQLYKMLETVPEFFYSTIRSDSNNQVTLRDLAQFSFELKQLFK